MSKKGKSIYLPEYAEVQQSATGPAMILSTVVNETVCRIEEQET